MTNENIVLSDFPKNVLDQANAAARLKPSSLLAYRFDLRGKTVISFSESADIPAECAFSLNRNGTNWQLGFHVADVCEYVVEGSPLDIEARRRKTTVNNGFINSPMLPAKIAELCDLSAGNDRLSLSVLLDIDALGKLLNVSIEESVIRIAHKCVYSEVDELVFASDASSVFGLREKYSPIFNTIVDMYELAALFCSERRKRGGLDCTVFRRIYEKDKNGVTVNFRFEAEPDTKAMIRELGYFATEAVGNYMYSRKLPCIFTGVEDIELSVLEYLEKLLNLDKIKAKTHERAADIAEISKGSPYYDFLCDTLSNIIPYRIYSAKPIFNIYCQSDKTVPFFHPATNYADLLAQRILKANIAAGSNALNLNINRYRKIVTTAAEDANKASEANFNIAQQFRNIAALEYISQNKDSEFTGFALLKNKNGEYPVKLMCGADAIIPKEIADNYSFDARPYQFRIISVGNDLELTKVAPVE